MILSFMDYCKKKQYLKFGKITELTGSNKQLQQYTMSMISKYFSKEKYSDEQTELYDYQVPKVYIDEEFISRSYFKTYSIQNLISLDTQLTMQKGTVLNEYINLCNDTLENNIYLEQIEKQLINISDEIYKNIDENIKPFLKIKNNVPKFEDIFKAFLDVSVYGNTYISYMESAEKLILYLNMILKIYEKKPTKTLICIENIQQFIKLSDLSFIKNIMNQAKNCDIFFLIQNDNAMYTINEIENLKYVNILSDITISLIDIDTLTRTINDSYPVYSEFDSYNMWSIYKRIAHNICNSLYTYCVSNDDVCLKIINECYNIKCGIDRKYQNVCKAEYDFLCDVK